MQQILIIGLHSFIAGSCHWENNHNVNVTRIGHQDWRNLDLSTFDVVVNFAYDPRLMKQDYVTEIDIDSAIAQAIAPYNTHMVLLSTRQVYGRSVPWPVTEDTVCNPDNFYGRNKLTIEKRVASILGERCTIARLSNIFGFEPGRHTFFGRALHTLKTEQRIVLDISPLVERDFLPVEACADILGRVAVAKPPGIINIGSGRATMVGQIALWVLEGYGSGELVVTSPRNWDMFVLDVARLAGVLGGPVPSGSIRERCINIGERLKNA